MSQINKNYIAYLVSSQPSFPHGSLKQMNKEVAPRSSSPYLRLKQGNKGQEMFTGIIANAYISHPASQALF